MDFLIPFFKPKFYAEINCDVLVTFTDNFAETAATNIGQYLRGRITDLVADWYSYIYDGGQSDINDGGRDMYDGGNRVRQKKMGLQMLFQKTYAISLSRAKFLCVKLVIWM